MNIVVLDGHVLNPGDLSWEPLEALGSLTVYERTAPQDIAARAQHADVVLTNKTRLSAETLDKLPALRCIGVLATGYDVVDLAAAARRGIPVCNVVAYGVDDVAQHVMALTLELCRRTTEHTQSVQRGDWAAAPDWCYWTHAPQSLRGLTMGIAGFGNIGRRVGEMAHVFGMNVLAVGHGTVTPPDYAPFACTDMDDMLTRADVITLHCPLTEETRGLINAERLTRMRRGALLINTARGPLLDEPAVAAALHAGTLGGLGVDVLSTEPPATDNPLLTAPNVLITPHIAWATRQARANIIALTAENLRCWQAGTPRNVVNAKLMA